MRTWILLLALVPLISCGRVADMMSEDKLQDYESLLSTSLEAWKVGRAKQLDQAEPPIRFIDDDSVAGLRLTQFHIKPTVRKNLPFQTFQVVLELRDQQNRDFARNAMYQVSLMPRPTVLRSDP